MDNRSMDMVSPNRTERPQYPALVTDGSLYSLKFEEFQSQLGNTGKPHHNMHFDELLKNVFSAESGQLVQNPSADSFLDLENNGLNGTTFSNKTINEAWREIVQQQQFNRSMENNHLQLHQSNLGELKLEDVFVRAAQVTNVIGDAQPLMPTIDPVVMVSQQEDWVPLQMQMQMQMPSINIHQQELQQQQQQHQQIIGLCPDFSVSSEPVYENSVMKIGYSEIPMVAAMSSTCSDTKGGAVVGRKRMYSDEMLEKTIERRQKRMAKNRESAAKSRAKKQAYIKKLEADKERLLRTNSWLHKLKEVETRLLSDTNLTPKYQLRRTSSTTF